MPNPRTVPQEAEAVAKVTTAPLVTVAGTTAGSVPTDAVGVGQMLKQIESVPPTPAPVALALMTTVVPVTDRTVVPAGMTLGAVTSRTVMPATIHAGVDAKCRVAFAAAVVALVVAVPATWTRA